MNPNEFLAIELMGWFDPDPKEGSVWVNESRSVCMRKCDWRPLENIQQAFEVVDRMVKNGWYYELGLAQGEGHECSFYIGGDDPLFRDEHINPATAITLAACKALKGEGG
jgi:hypothetical protein